MIVQPRSLLDYCYPVGSIYTSTNSTSPAVLFGGGTWTQIKDTFLLTAGDTYTAGDTGGSATVTPSGTVNGHTLTTSEIPSHRHQTYGVSASGASSGTAANLSFQGDGNVVIYYTNGAIGLGSTSHTGTQAALTIGGNQSGYSGYTGGGGSHNHGLTMNSQTNMPPYKVVYAWERTA